MEKIRKKYDKNQKNNLKFQKYVVYYRCVRQATSWCNGSTTGFGPVSLSSNLDEVAIF